MSMLFSLLGMFPFSLAKPTKHRANPLLSPTKLPSLFPPTAERERLGSVRRLPLHSVLSTYSGLGKDGLRLSFLGRHHWTLLAVPTETELFDTDCSFGLSSLYNVTLP